VSDKFAHVGPELPLAGGEITIGDAVHDQLGAVQLITLGTKASAYLESSA